MTDYPHMFTVKLSESQLCYIERLASALGGTKSQAVRLLIEKGRRDGALVVLAGVDAAVAAAGMS